jgi:uncharacterized protein (TIGR02268 family)
VFALSSTALLGLALLASPTNATERVSLPTCEVGTRYIELTADAPSKTPEVCIRPELSITLLFDAKLARVEVEGRERFRRVKVVDDTLMLVASEALHDGERVRVTVYFEGGAAPADATFMLVVHPSQAERQVEVSRHTRTVASLRQGEQQARVEAQQCREEKARLQAECGGQVGLTGLIEKGWLGEKDIVAKVLEKLTQRPGDSILVHRAISYRAVGPEGRGRVAVKVELFNKGTVPWTPTGAALVGSKREALTRLPVWILEPIPPGKYGSITVEMNAAESEVRGTYTLKLWAGEAGDGGVTLDDVTFP